MASRNRTNARTFRIDWDEWTYLLQGETLRLCRRDTEMAALSLAPVADGTPRTLGPWREAGADHLRATVAGVGSAHLAVREGHVAFWVETQKKHFDTFTYFSDAAFEGERWHTYVSDSWDRTWSRDLYQEVGISSAYKDAGVFGHDGAGLTDPGDAPVTWVWNMPPRTFSIETADGWVGFSIPGALPVGVTHVAMKDRRLGLSFEVLRPGCRESGMPVVYFVPGLADPYDLLDEHRVISERLGLTREKRAKHPSWWTRPVFKAYLEHQRLLKNAKTDEERRGILTTEALLDWTFTVKESLQADEMMAIFEQGVYRMYGDYTPIDSLGGAEGFRKTVDALRRKGVRVCYYVHPFVVNTKIPFYQAHPEAFCKPKDPSVVQRYALEMYDDKPEFALLDWTHPAGRKYMLSQVELVLSDEKGCLNCDWLRSNHWRSPAPRHFDFHDPDWGIGDLMSMKVQKLLYEKAKRVKPHCCVSKVAFADPYMQPYADVDLLCEDWNGWTDTWYRRGRIATRLARDTLFCTDPYFLTITKSYEYYMAMMAWCICEAPDVRHAIHPYTSFRELRPKEYKRRLAGVKAQENAPLRATDLVQVEPPARRDGEPTIWRKRTQGKLAGFYAALAPTRRSLVTYSETEARVATSETRHVEFPLPPGARVLAVERVPHEGTIKNWPARLAEDDAGAWVEMKIEDCAGKALYYRVRYRLS